MSPFVGFLMRRRRSSVTLPCGLLIFRLDFVAITSPPIHWMARLRVRARAFVGELLVMEGVLALGVLQKRRWCRLAETVDGRLRGLTYSGTTWKRVTNACSHGCTYLVGGPFSGHNVMARLKNIRPFRHCMCRPAGRVDRRGMSEQQSTCCTRKHPLKY